MRQNLTLWEKALSDALNQTVKFDESDVFLAEIDLQLINFHYQDSVLVIYACVGEINNPQQALELLQANCFWQATKGATLSLMEDETVVLALQCSIQNKSNLNQLITQFLSTLYHWSQYLTSQSDSTGITESKSKLISNSKTESKRWLSIDLL